MHVVEFSSEYVPKGHATGPKDGFEHSEPAGQTRHTASPIPEYVPGSHGMHSDCP